MVFLSRPLVALAAVGTYMGLALAFQSAADYDAYKTTNLYNCTGGVPVSNVTAPNAADTLPQIESSEGQQGWEQWVLFLQGPLPTVLRWNQGDPSSSEPASASFDVLIVDVNGTNVQSTVRGTLSYTDSNNVKRITIGDNVLTWDRDALWYNVSVSVDGYALQLSTFSTTGDSFHPNVGYYNGLLDDSDDSGGWFGSVPLIRGHAVGRLSTPQGQNITLVGLSALKHMFSETPLPEYITQYTGATAWGNSSSFYDTHIFYQTETIDGMVHEAAYLGRAVPSPGQQGVISSAWATYAVTDDFALYNLTVNNSTSVIDASFSGCANASTSTASVPYTFHIGYLTLLGSFTDLGGGTTSYYSINGTTSAAFGGAAVDGTLTGILEEYEAPQSLEYCN